MTHPLESLLRETLTTTAQSITTPPPLPTPTHRRTLPRLSLSFPHPLTAALISAALIATVFQVVKPAPLPTEAATSPPPPYQLTAYLCVSTSSQPSCAGKNTTPAQRQAIADLLTSLPEVHSFHYESQPEAYTRFHTLFPHTPTLLSGLRPGDIPDSFRIRTTPTAIPYLTTALTPLPGIDTLVPDPTPQPPT
ncbi:permease-like cell division protein FtsX [Actinocorallia sp. A-T 12471]|uniref:permease-like cell division protein FtsX n=1 Tax=Actinocorallia sp. A-T 12471 TaxID=3089813 RepID=UPI0029D05344|nr:permease-like cell division protein FtsX [Actinocorallia sp. A-T 12471]MDX6739778.1 permease-like cell division protein FtsX [Actinocorallia sp. A-T 12471]